MHPNAYNGRWGCPAGPARLSTTPEECHTLKEREEETIRQCSCFAALAPLHASFLPQTLHADQVVKLGRPAHNHLMSFSGQAFGLLQRTSGAALGTQHGQKQRRSQRKIVQCVALAEPEAASNTSPSAQEASASQQQAPALLTRPQRPLQVCARLLRLYPCCMASAGHLLRTALPIVTLLLFIS